MADTKISALGELAEAPASGDLISIVDVSDTTQAATGSTKRITTANFLSSAGQTLYTTIVDASGNGDYTTLGAAISAGATSIFVRNGSYTESALTVSTADITVTGESSTGVVLNIGSNTWSVGSAATDFTLRSVTILSSNGRILFDTATGWTIRDCIIKATQTSNSVVQAYNCTRGQFTNNRFIDQGTSAGLVRFSFGDGVGLATNVTGNVFYINPMEVNNISVGNLNNFTGNTVQHNGGNGTGALVTAGGICNISGNYLTGRVNSSVSKVCDGIRTTSAHANVVGNYLYECKGTGININSTANVVSGNSIDYSDVGIRIAGSDNIVTSNFHSSATTGVSSKIGLWIDSGGRNVVAHNNLQDNTTGILVDASLSANQLLYNLVYNNTTKITDNSSGYTTPTVSVGNITA